VLVNFLCFIAFAKMREQLAQLTRAGHVKANQRVARRPEIQARHPVLIEPRLDLTISIWDSKLFEENGFHNVFFAE